MPRRKRTAPPASASPAARLLPFRFWYREDGIYCGDGMFRWWRSDWFGDQFDIIDAAELQKRKEGAEMCSILVTKLGPDEEPEERIARENRPRETKLDALERLSASHPDDV